MAKIIRIFKEALFAFWLYRNPIRYCLERCGFFSDRRLTIALRNGIAYRINANTSDVRILDEIWRGRIYDPLARFIGPESTVIDIGAQVGVFTVKAGRLVSKGKVLSFEPFPGNFEVLRENIALNGLEKVVTPFNLAVTGRSGAVDFYIHDRDTGGGSIHPHGDKQSMKKISVSSVSLEEVFRMNGIAVCDFIKMDCEGAELDILIGAPRELFQKIQSMTIEWHEDHNQMGIAEFKKFLSERGYHAEFNKKTGTVYAWKV